MERPPEGNLPRIETEQSREDLNQASEGAANDIAGELVQNVNFESRRGEENRPSLIKRIGVSIKEYWRQSGIGAAFGFVSASAARIAIKQSALLYLGGSMGAGAVAGAVAGAAIEGVKVYARERKKFVAEDIMAQINNEQDFLKKAAIVAKAEESLKEARISDSPEAKELAGVVRAARLLLETGLQKKELSGKSEEEQISWLLKVSGRNLKEISRAQKKNAKLLLKKIEFKSEKSKVDLSKVGRAILRGGLVGALGGAIGGALSHYVFDNLHPGQWLEQAVKPVQDSVPGISQSEAEAIAERTFQRRSEAAATAAARVIAEGKNRLLQDKFIAVAQRGDGWTHLARKAVHDYLVNLHELSLDSAPSLSPEQLVHVEDTLVKEKLHSGVGELIHPGQKLEISGAKIQSLIEKAQGLSSEKIQNISNILKTPEHHLSSATRFWMDDYGHISNSGNDFASAIADRAKEEAQLAAVAVQEIVVPEKPQKASNHVKSLLVVLGAGALAGYAAKRMFGRERLEKEEPVSEDERGRQELISKLAELKRQYSIVSEIDLPNFGMGLDNKGQLAVIDKLGAVLANIELDEIRNYFPNGIILTNQNQYISGDKILLDYRKTGDELSLYLREAINYAKAQTVTPIVTAPIQPEPAPETVPVTDVTVQPVPEEIKEERDNPLRAAAWYAAERLMKYDELGTSEQGVELKTPEERQARFIELIRKYWTEFTTHGFYGTELDPVTGEPKILPYSDLDASACLFLLKEAGIIIDKDKINYVKQGGSADKGVILDTSNEFGVIAKDKGKTLTIDHHTSQPSRDTSSTRFLYELLADKEIGLLKKEPWMERFVEFVTKEDNKDYTDDEAKAVLDNYGRNFVSLASNLDFEQMKTFFKDGRYNPYQKLPEGRLRSLKFTYAPLRNENRSVSLGKLIEDKKKYKEESLKKIEEMEQEHFVFDSGVGRFGKILIDTGWENNEGEWQKKVRLDFDAVRPQGYGGYLVWMPEKEQFFLKTVKEIDFEIQDTFNVRGHYLLKGDRTTDLKVELDEILSKLAGDPSYKIEGELKTAIDTEKNKRENIAEKIRELSQLLADKTLTQDHVRQTAGGLKMNVFDLLYRVLRLNAEALKIHTKLFSENKAKKTDDVKEKLVLGALQEYVSPAPASAPLATPVAPVSAQEAIPSATVATGQARETLKPVEDFSAVLQERYPDTAAKLVGAEHWGELNIATQNFISAGLLRLLDVNHWIEKDLGKYNEFIFNISATPDELNQPDYVWIEGIQLNKSGNLEISIKFDDSKGAVHGFNLKTGNPFNIVHLNVVMEEWNKALRLNDLDYSRDWTQGRSIELKGRFPNFFDKISHAENWDELDEETKDNLADAFLVFFDLYPEYHEKIQSDNYNYVIEMSDQIKNEMKSGKLVILAEVLIDSDNLVELRLVSKDKKDWRYVDRLGYLDGSTEESISSTLKGLY